MAVDGDSLAKSSVLRSHRRPYDNSICLDANESEQSPLSSRQTSHKRKAKDTTQKDQNHVRPPSKKPRLKKSNDEKTEEPGEKRLRRYRSKAPLSYHQIAERALTQRLCVLDRQRTGDNEETIEMAGTTGNVYTIKINQVSSCDCPHSKKGNQCKHIVYVMKRTLRAPEHLAYQLALLPSELEEIFAHAPPIPTAKGKVDAEDAATDQDTDPNRKPVDDDCPICCVDFDPHDDVIVWCKAACGNNVHKGCFDTWAKMKRSQGMPVTCPFCRTPWLDEGLSEMIGKDAGIIGPEGYLNVASSLGLSGYRDYSTYHQPWVNQRRRAAGGYLEDEDSMGDFW